MCHVIFQFEINILQVYLLLPLILPGLYTVTMKFASPLTFLSLLVPSVLGYIADTVVIHDNSDIEDNDYNIDTITDIIISNGQSFISIEANDNDLELNDINGNLLYKNLVILSNKAKSLGSNIDYKSLLSFAENGGNIIITSDSINGTNLDNTLFLNEIGIYPSPKGYKYIDYHTNNGDSNVNINSNQFLNEYIISSSNEDTGMEIKLKDPSVALISNSEFLIPLLQTSRSSFSKDKSSKKDIPWHTGLEGYLAVAFQGRNNGRITWIGSKNILFEYPEITNEITQWTFQQKSVIKVNEFIHKRVDNEGNEIIFVDEDDFYKQGDLTDVKFSMIELKNGEWVPFVANETLQLEFIMLDPFQRLKMENLKNGSHHINCKLPDQFGIFTFRIDYRKPGLTYLRAEDIVTVRHLAEDEHGRSWENSNSYVYLAGLGSVIASWLIFVILFLFTSEDSK